MVRSHQVSTVWDSGGVSQSVWDLVDSAIELPAKFQGNVNISTCNVGGSMQSRILQTSYRVLKWHLPVSSRYNSTNMHLIEKHIFPAT